MQTTVARCVFLQRTLLCMEKTTKVPQNQLLDYFIVSSIYSSSCFCHVLVEVAVISCLPSAAFGSFNLNHHSWHGSFEAPACTKTNKPHQSCKSVAFISYLQYLTKQLWFFFLSEIKALFIIVFRASKKKKKKLQFVEAFCMSAAPVIMGGSCVDCSFLDEHSPSHTFVSQWGGGSWVHSGLNVWLKALYSRCTNR